MSYYDNNSDDREEMMPGDEEENSGIPENLTPDHPEYEYFKSMFGGQGPIPFMQGAFKVVPDGKGGFTKVPLSPEELEAFKKIFMGASQQRNTGASTTNSSMVSRPSQYPHYLFLNREYVIQFINGVTTQGPDVTLYLEVIKNPMVTNFQYSLLDVYEKLNDNQFLTFLISMYADLYLWDTSGVKINIVQNTDPMYKDEKIVVIIKASKTGPDLIGKLNPIDFVGYEITDVVSPFKDIPAQIFQNVYVQKHIYQPVVRVDATFTVGSNLNIKFTSPAIDMYGIYHQLVIPVLIDAVEIFYPKISMTSFYSRKSLNSVHIAYETRISDNLLEVIAYISPAYIMNHTNHIFGFMPLNDGLFAVSQMPIEDSNSMQISPNEHGSILSMLNTFYSSQDSQVFNVSRKPLGWFDVYNNSYGVSIPNATLFLFGHFPSETLFNNWVTEDQSRIYDCDIFESRYSFIRRYMIPVAEAFIPSNPDDTGITAMYYKVFGFFEMDVIEANNAGINTFEDAINATKPEIIQYLKLSEKDFVGMTTDPQFILSEVWVDGSVARMIICKCGPLESFASSDYVKEILARLKQINEAPQHHASTTPSWKKLFGNVKPK